MRPLLATAALIFVFATHAAATEPTLAELFDRAAFSPTASPQPDRLFRWFWPTIGVHYTGPGKYRQNVADHLVQLGAATGLETRMDDVLAKMRIEVGDFHFDAGQPCVYQVTGNGARIYVRADLPAQRIRACIATMTTNALGLLGSLDGIPGGPQNTVLSAKGLALHLTETDHALLRILFDGRLWNGMPRDDVMAIVPMIIEELPPTTDTP